MTKELLHKFLNNECSPQELNLVVSWIKTEGPLIEGEKWTLEEWQRFKAEKDDNNSLRFNSMLDKIHHQIILEQSSSTSEPVEGKSISLLTWITRAAAILLLPVITFLFFTLSQHNFEIGSVARNIVDTMEVVAPIGSKTHFILADGSEVYLNHGSSLKYPNKFSKKKREVILKGEGYFKVAHNPAHPFVVKTQNMNITALGTEFNVFAYPDEQTVATTLIDGKVAVEKITQTGKNEMLGEMIPGQYISYNIHSDQVTGSHGDVDKYVSWTEGKLIFKNDPIDQIANRLGRWYNVEIEFTDENVKNYTYTATFVDETLTQILDLMAIATPINYEVKPREKRADGTFTKQKVTISEKK